MPELPKLDLVYGGDAWPDAASPDKHFELSWRLGEGVRMRYGKDAIPTNEHVALNRKAISTARHAKTDAEYVERLAIRARDSIRDKARHKGERADEKRQRARALWEMLDFEARKEISRVRCGEEYHRDFVFIDAEGQNYPGNDIVRVVPRDGMNEANGTIELVYPDHGTFLLGALAWVRDNPGTGKGDHSGNQGHCERLRYWSNSLPTIPRDRL